MKFDITKVVEEIAMQAEENQEEFIFETIKPYCENILQIKINKEELKQILLNGMQKQQLCGDCISRAEAISRIEVRRKITCESDPYNYEEWTKGYEEGIDDAIAMINSVPSVTPQQKVGKWTCTDDMDEYYGKLSRCSVCGGKVLEADRYCPYCGAEMGVSDETI